MLGVWDWIYLAFLSMVPVVEGRYAIIYAIHEMGADPLSAFLWCATFNILASPLVYFGLSVVYTRWLCKIDFIRVVYDFCVKRVSSKNSKPLEKWQELGLIFFVAIPLPVTGVWTATLLAWLFELEVKKSIIVIGIGVIIACAITTLLTVGILSI